jgi:hypothetical protein
MQRERNGVRENYRQRISEFTPTPKSIEDDLQMKSRTSESTATPKSVEDL